jgi:ElaB/YqjD/DUF883 family membrane-anchored ribosome-binding protein
LPASPPACSSLLIDRNQWATARASYAVFPMYCLNSNQELKMSIQSERLMTDVKVLVKDTEELVNATVAQAGDKIADIRNRAQAAANNLKPQLATLQSNVVDRAKGTATAADTYIHENPWTAIGVSAGIGLVIGLLIGRR